MDSEANLSTALQILGSVQHFAVAGLDHVRLLDSRSTNDTNRHTNVLVICDGLALVYRNIHHVS